MMRAVNAIGLLTAAMVVMAGAPATAAVLDAVYRGTLVCDKLPFTETKMREAINVTIVGGAAHYSHVVRLKPVAPEPVAEQGFGTVIGQAISLQGSWSGGAREYKAAYGRIFVRRTARLKGIQTWTVGGKTITRVCSGAIKRPLEAFLPRQKRSPL